LLLTTIPVYILVIYTDVDAPSKCIGSAVFVIFMLVIDFAAHYSGRIDLEAQRLSLKLYKAVNIERIVPEVAVGNSKFSSKVCFALWHNRHVGLMKGLIITFSLSVSLSVLTPL